MATWEDVRRLALALPEVAESATYGQPSWKVRDKLFAKNWRNIDYLVMSNKMQDAMEQNNDDGREDWILTALANSDPVWVAQRGDIGLAVYRVRK